MSFMKAERFEDFTRVRVSEGCSNPDFRGQEIDFYNPQQAIKLAEGERKLLRVTEARAGKLVMKTMTGEEYVFETVRIGRDALSGKKILDLASALCGIGIGLQA